MKYIQLNSNASRPKYRINRVESLTEVQVPTNVQVKENGGTQQGKIVVKSTYTIIPIKLSEPIITRQNLKI